MRIFTPIIVLILAVCSGFGQGTQVIRTPLTTNNMMNAPQDGWIAIWNNIAKKWSNGVNTASATNASQPPSTVLSNLTTTGVAPGATNASAYIASASGLGTNINLKSTSGASRALMVNTNLLVVTNGNVGIGTDAPGSKLTVNGAIAVNGGINATTVNIDAGVGSSFSDNDFAGEKVLVSGLGPNANIEESSVTVVELENLRNAGPAKTNFITASFGTSHHTNGVYIGTTGSAGTYYLWDNAAGAFRQAVIMGGATFIWGTNITTHQFRGTGVSPNVDDTTTLGNASQRWKGGFFKDFVRIDGGLTVASNASISSLAVTNDQTIGGNLNVGGVTVLNALDVTSSLSSTSTNLIDSQAEDVTPAAGDYVLVHDVSTASLTKVQLGNLPTSGASVTVTSNAMLTGSSAANITNAARRFYFETNLAPILSNLVAAAVSGDTVELGEGVFNTGLQTIRVPVGVRMVGQGIDKTVISGMVGLATNYIVQIMSTNIVEDLTVRAGNRSAYLQNPMGFFSARGHASVTNTVIRRVKLDGETDSFLGMHSAPSFGVIEDCDFTSKWDVFRLSGPASASIPASSWVVRRTRMVSDVLGATEANTVANNKATPIKIEDSADCVFIDCEVIATNGLSSFCLYSATAAGDHTNKVFIAGGRWEAAGTNEAAKIDNSNKSTGQDNTPVTVQGTSIADPDGYYDTIFSVPSILTFLPLGVTAFNVYGLQTNFADISIESGGNLRVVNDPVTEFTVYGESIINALDPSGIFAFNVERSLNVNTNMQVDGTNASRHVKLTGGQSGSSILRTDSNTNIVAATIGSGLAFDGTTLSATASGGGGPGTLPMNANQFDTNNPVTIKNGALLTNTSIRTALTLPTLTASRAMVLNSSGQATNSPNVTDTELEFLDGVTSAIQTQLSNDVRVVAGTGGITVTAAGSGAVMTYTVNDDDAGGGGGSTNNPVQAVGTLILTNGTIYKPMDLGDNTNGVVSWNTNYYVWSPSNTFTLSWTDVPASTDARQIFIKIINTNATAGFFPTNGLNGGSVILLPALSTNEYTLNKDTNGFWIRSGQILTTGTGDTNVFNISPVIHGLTNKGTLTVDSIVSLALPYTVPITGTNFIVDWAALKGTNTVILTNYANAGLIQTNISNAKDRLVMILVNGSQGFNNIVTNGPDNQRMTLVHTGITRSTNGNYKDFLVWVPDGNTNAVLSGQNWGARP